MAFSSSGAVAGFCATSADWIKGGSEQGFVYANGTLSGIVNPAGATGLPFGINASAMTVGIEIISNSGGGFVWQDGHYLMPSGLNLATNNIPLAINDAGQIVSTTISGNSSNASYAVSLWNNGASATAISGPGYALPTAINNHGDLAGWISTSGKNAVVHPFAWIGGQLQSLTLPPGYTQGIATNISDEGVVIGASYAGSAPNVLVAATIYKDGQGSLLGTLPNLPVSAAYAINHAGDIVGSSGLQISTGIPNTFFAAVPLYPITLIAPPSSDLRAFLYHAGTMYDLNSLIPADSGWTLSFAIGINDAGQIAGTGFHNGQERAFLLTPAAAGPTISAVVGAGLSMPSVTTLTTNGLFTIFGKGFAAPGAAAQLPAPGGMLETNFANTCVQVGNQMAPLIYVSPGQINAQVPAVNSSGMVPVSVITNCGTATPTASAPFMANVAAAAPEFLYFTHNSKGSNPVAAIDNNTAAYIGPTGLIPDATFTPAKAGEIVTIFGVGFGQTMPAQTPGTLATAAAPVPGATVTFNGSPITPFYVGISPDFAGLYQLSIAIPAGLAPGAYPIEVTVAGVSSPPDAFLQVGQ
jgi:uncharacterized protein (TIGR03437 family)